MEQKEKFQHERAKHDQRDDPTVHPFSLKKEARTALLPLQS